MPGGGPSRHLLFVARRLGPCLSGMHAGAGPDPEDDQARGGEGGGPGQAEGQVPPQRGVAERAAHRELGGAEGGEPFQHRVVSANFRTGTSTLGSGEFEAELASVPPGDGGVGGQVGSAEDG